jgi:hypothetical protein
MSAVLEIRPFCPVCAKSPIRAVHFSAGQPLSCLVFHRVFELVDTSGSRTFLGAHQGLHGVHNAPPGNPSACGEIRKKPVVFGLHNHYYREAA